MAIASGRGGQARPRSRSTWPRPFSQKARLGSSTAMSRSPTAISTSSPRSRLTNQWARPLPMAVCTNKTDLNRNMAATIRRVCAGSGLPVVGELSYDTRVIQAQVEGRSIVEHGGSPVAEEIARMWESLENMLTEAEA